MDPRHLTNRANSTQQIDELAGELTRSRSLEKNEQSPHAKLWNLSYRVRTISPKRQLQRLARAEVRVLNKPHLHGHAPFLPYSSSLPAKNYFVPGKHITGQEYPRTPSPLSKGTPSAESNKDKPRPDLLYLQGHGTTGSMYAMRRKKVRYSTTIHFLWNTYLTRRTQTRIFLRLFDTLSPYCILHSHATHFKFLVPYRTRHESCRFAAGSCKPATLLC